MGTCQRQEWTQKKNQPKRSVRAYTAYVETVFITPRICCPVSDQRRRISQNLWKLSTSPDISSEREVFSSYLFHSNFCARAYFSADSSSSVVGKGVEEVMTTAVTTSSGEAIRGREDRGQTDGLAAARPVSIKACWRRGSLSLSFWRSLEAKCPPEMPPKL